MGELPEQNSLRIVTKSLKTTPKETIPGFCLAHAADTLKVRA